MQKVLLFQDRSKSSITFEVRRGLLWLILEDRLGKVEYAIMSYLQIDSLIYVLNNLLDGDYQTHRISVFLGSYPATIAIELRQQGSELGSLLLTDCTKNSSFVGGRSGDFSLENLGELRDELKAHRNTMAVQ